MRSIYCIVLLFAVNIFYAQVTLKGIVKDSLNTPFELANVVAINEQTSGLESYGITDKLGNYKLQLGKNGTYTIQVSYVGMKTYAETLTTLSLIHISEPTRPY